MTDQGKDITICAKFFSGWEVFMHTSYKGRGVFYAGNTGFPYMRETVVMTRHYPNIYLDLGWTHAISPQIVTGALAYY